MLYCVGIHFRKYVDFTPSVFKDSHGNVIPVPAPGLMSGADILAEAAKLYGLRYQLTASPPSVLPGHNSYLSWSPAPDNAHVPPMLSSNNPPFRTTFATVFPFIGQPLSLTEVLAPIGQISHVLQYTVTPFTLETKPPTPTIPFPVKTLNDVGPGSNAQFGTNGFPDNCEIRLRLVAIHCAY